MKYFIKYSLGLVALLMMLSYIFIDANSTEGLLLGLALFILGSRTFTKFFNGDYNRIKSRN
mgnify:CR=1 FL=1